MFQSAPESVDRRSWRGLPFEGDSLVDMLRYRAAIQPDDVGYVFLRDGEVPSAMRTWAELDRQSRAIAAWLQARVRAGDRALLVYPPGLEFVAAFFGCLYAGVLAVPVPLPQGGRHRRGLDRLESIARDAEPVCALTTAGALTTLERDGLHGFGEQSTPGMWCATDALQLGVERDWVPIATDRTSLAFLQYTSGSTARPKGVMVSHGNLLHNLRASLRLGGTDPHTVFVSWLPVTHDMGLIEGVLQPAFCGCPVYLMSPAAFLQRPVRWLRAISTYGATRSGGPNFAYDLTATRVSSKDCVGLNLSRWRIAFNGAEPIRADTMTAFAEVFAPNGFRPTAFRPCYGLAESTLLVTTTEWTPGAVGPVSCGSPAPGLRIRIVDPLSGVACPPGVGGEIQVSGDSVTQGYWNRADDTVAAFATDHTDPSVRWLRTGDLGFLRNGELVVTGRSKDLLIVRGAKHFPHDLERTCERVHAAVRRGGVAAFAVTSGVRGDRVALIAEVDAKRVASGQMTRLIADMRSAVTEAHGIQLSAIALVGPGVIPKTTSGKLQRFRCRETWLAGSLESIACWCEDGGAGVVP